MTDVAGSTRLWETRADTMRAAILRHDAIVQQAIDSNGGQLIKERGEGDSHFCVFPNPDGAICAAIQIQTRLPEEQWETGVPLVVRMSIHTTDAEPHGRDYYGRDINRCARIRSAAHGGQILVSDATRDSVEGFDFLDLGLHRLMDLSEPQRIYQVVSPDIKSDFPPPRSLNAVKHNLPIQLTTFIGRERELEELRSLLMGPRLISVLGPGGAGKTRTALQLAAESVDQVKGGVWFVDLSPIQDGSTLGQKVIEDLHIRVGADDPDDAIAAHFQGEKALFILDNCEHVAHDAAVFTEKLLKKCPSLFVIATSREPLGVAGERAYRLPPMAVKAERTDSLDDILHLDSVRLLLDRARAKGSEEVLTRARPQVVLELCRKLDGIPLALEQAAANLGVLSPEAMLARLDERLSILSIDDKGFHARHRTLSAAIDWSYETLNNEERELFLDLAVFVGGWTLEAAESICALPKVLDLMQRLVSKSLIWPEATAHGDRRFRLLETMREYALERRSAIPESLADRHFAYFMHLAMVAELAGMDVDDGRWAKALDADHPNIIAALRHGIQSRGNANDALSFVLALRKYWLLRSYYVSAGTWYQQALDAAPHAPTAIRAEALNMLGIFAWYLGRLGPAKNALQASLSLSMELNDAGKVAFASNNLALLAREVGDFAEASRLLKECSQIFESLGDEAQLADVLLNLSQNEADQGNLEQAIGTTERAISLRRRVKDRFKTGVLIMNLLGFYAQRDGSIKSHLDLLEEGIVLSQEAGNPDLSASTLDVVAFLARECEDTKIATRFVAAAEKLTESAGIQLSHYTNQFRQQLSDQLQNDLGRQAFKREKAQGMKLNEPEAMTLASTFVSRL
jgi:predicted ATPase